MLPYIGASDVIPGSAHWTEHFSFHSSSSFVSKKQFSRFKENIQSEVSGLYVYQFTISYLCGDLVTCVHTLPFLVSSFWCLFQCLLPDSCQFFLRSLFSFIIFISVKSVPRDSSFLYYTKLISLVCTCPAEACMLLTDPY